jgi:hypothetical protein
VRCSARNSPSKNKQNLQGKTKKDELLVKKTTRMRGMEVCGGVRRGEGGK